MSRISDWVREEFKKGDDQRDAGLTTPENIVRVDDIIYGDDSRQQSLDVYRPKSREGELLPVIVNVHGGGWVYGDKERYQYYAMDLSQRGFAVVNFSYRLAPEHTFPAPLEDTNSVFTWILSHAEEYRFNLGQVFAVGDSAGANILALYSCMCTNPDYAAMFSFVPPTGFAPRAVALNCGVYELEMGKSDFIHDLAAEYLPGGLTEEGIHSVSVTNFITKAFPPAFVMTSVDDPFKTQGLFLAEKLCRAEVPFVFRFCGDCDNRLPHVFHLNIRSRDARLCNDEECAFFRSLSNG